MFDIKKIAALGVVVSSALILSACNLYKSPATSTSPAEQEATTTPVEGNVVTYSDSGFSPATVTVKVGGAVEFKNDSASNIQVNSAAHPVHTQFPELNVGQIAPGESKSVTFTTAGTKKYHNHLNASQTGTIVVE